jgi:hypothetical protein
LSCQSFVGGIRCPAVDRRKHSRRVVEPIVAMGSRDGEIARALKK